MRRIAPIIYPATGIFGRSVFIAEDESEDVSAIDNGFEVIDLRLARWIPSAVKAWAVLPHTWEFGGWPKEGKMSDIDYGPESDEKYKSSGVCVRHGSCLSGIQGFVELLPNGGQLHFHH